MKATKLERMRSAIQEQEEWIAGHGATLAGYVARYGRPGEPDCYGNGGEAIYRADTQALEALRDEYRWALAAR